MLDLLGGENPWVIRRNAAIALANVGRERAEAIEALHAQIAGADDALRDYLRWAIEVLCEG